MSAAAEHPDELVVEFAGEMFTVTPGDVFRVGREGDLVIDDNLFLHRHFLTIESVDRLWLLSNVGTRLSATVTDSASRVQAWLAPGARLPLVFASTSVIFSAGATTYELTIHIAEPAFRETQQFDDEDGQSTIGEVPLTPSQRVMILALAEPLLRREGTGMSELPTSAEAARRIGWTLTRFNRKLDTVCDKLDRIGVPGMRGGARAHATNRRARLVEHAIAARLVTRENLPLLDLELLAQDDLEGAEDRGAGEQPVAEGVEASGVAGAGSERRVAGVQRPVSNRWRPPWLSTFTTTPRR